MSRPAETTPGPGPVTPIGSFAELLALPGVAEEVEVRSTVGVCALHGGGLERATEVVAREVAARTGSSYYAVIQPDGSRRHLPSTLFLPGVSDALDTFLHQVDTVLSVHGYGRDDDFWAVLVGGANRALAHTWPATSGACYLRSTGWSTTWAPCRARFVGCTPTTR